VTVFEGVTNELGEITFRPGIGGCCVREAAAVIEADPGAVILLPIYDELGSTDNNGDGSVDHSDFVEFQQRFTHGWLCP
jgi:hypothetical protein